MTVRTVASDDTLDHYLAWADAAGFRILEHPDYGGVTPSLHIPGSYHGKGMAGDLNWGPAGAPAGEMSKLAYAAEVAQSMGLGCILASRGTGGSASSHRDHLHVDRSSSTNFGDRYTTTPHGTRKVQRLQGVVHFPAAQRDNLWGPDTEKRLDAVRQASRFGGTDFPHGVKTAQLAVGTKADGKWGDASRAAHDRTVQKVQRVLGVGVDGVWGKKTDAAYLKLRKAWKR